VSENPYQAPLAFGPPPAAANADGTLPRPVGVSILAVLHVLFGVLLVGAQFLMLARLSAMEDSLRAIGMPPMLLLIGVLFLSVLAIASGIGMWLGTQWGWWCATFYYVYSVFRNGSALLTVASLADQMESSTRGPEYYIMQYGGRMVVHFLLLLYFFKGNVLEFFHLENVSKPKAIGILVGVCIAIMVFTSAIRWLSG
jgi:hypothetical protein